MFIIYMQFFIILTTLGAYFFISLRGALVVAILWTLESCLFLFFGKTIFTSQLVIIWGSYFLTWYLNRKK